MTQHRLPTDLSPIHYYLERLAREGSPFLIQIGANDGVTGDPVFDFIKRYQWAGLLVEPLPDIFARLRDNYREAKHLTLANCAIGSAERMTLYRISGNVKHGPPWLHLLASFSRDVLLKHKHYLPDLADHIVEEHVPCVSFAELVKRHEVSRVDLLVIDTEGYDLEVLKLVDLHRFLPKIILVEQKHLAATALKEAQALLSLHGYALIDQGDDILAVSKKWAATTATIEDYDVLAAMSANMAQLNAKLARAEQLAGFLAKGGLFRTRTMPGQGLVIDRVGD